MYFSVKKQHKCLQLSSLEAVSVWEPFLMTMRLKPSLKLHSGKKWLPHKSFPLTAYLYPSRFDGFKKRAPNAKIHT